VPYSEDGEDEQQQRADRLARLGVLRSIPLDGLDARRLAESVIEAATSSPARVSLDLDGRNTSARIVAALCSAHATGVGV
jgi:predicted glycosyltransferase